MFLCRRPRRCRSGTPDSLPATPLLSVPFRRRPANIDPGSTPPSSARVVCSPGRSTPCGQQQEGLDGVIGAAQLVNPDQAEDGGAVEEAPAGRGEVDGADDQRNARPLLGHQQAATPARPVARWNRPCQPFTAIESPSVLTALPESRLAPAGSARKTATPLPIHQTPNTRAAIWVGVQASNLAIARSTQPADPALSRAAAASSRSSP